MSSEDQQQTDAGNIPSSASHEEFGARDSRSPDNTIGVIALVPDAWTHIVMPRHQVLKRLGKHFAVVWVEPAKGWREFLRMEGLRLRDRWRTVAPGVEVYSASLMHPQFFRPSWLERLSFRSRLAAARRRLIRSGAKRIILYVWRDEFVNALNLVAYDVCCYHIDDEYSFAERERPISDRERRILEHADQVIVHSRELMRKKGPLNRHSVMIPNGVDFAQFSAPHSEPLDMAAIPRPRFGYAGVIKKQLDLALLVRLARSRPKYSFVLVGPIMNISGKEKHVADLRQMPNVHFLGQKSVDELAAYMQHFDTCLMCYEVNDYTNCIFPLKLNEYLATGRPTISSSINAVTSFNDVVEIAKSDADWLRAMDDSMRPEASSSEAIKRRRECAKRFDWDLLVQQIASTLSDALSRKIASADLNDAASQLD